VPPSPPRCEMSLMARTFLGHPSSRQKPRDAIVTPGAGHSRGRFDASGSWRAGGSRATLRAMADVILIAVSLALAAYYVIRLFKFFPAAQQSKRGDGRLK
jgi:hypothetical protein